MKLVLALLTLALAAGAARAHVSAAPARVELTSYEAVYQGLLKQGLRVQYELTRATNFASASGEVTNVEWFAKDSFNAKLHGGREYLDVLGGGRYLGKLPGVDAARVGLYGP